MSHNIEAERVLKLISQVSRKPVAEITPELAFRKDLRMDSLMSLDLLVLIEEDFGVVIPQEQAVHIQTVQQLIDYLK